MIEIKRTEEKFEFSYDGKEYSVPSMRSIPLAEMNKMLDASQDGELADIKATQEFFKKYAPGFVKSAAFGDYADAVAAWQRDSGVNAGE